MKRISIIAAVLLAVLCVACRTNAQSAKSTPGLAVSGSVRTTILFHLADGTSLIGRPKIAAFKMRLSDAHVARIVRKEGVEGDETWEVEFQNGDALSGVLSADLLELQTPFGNGPVFDLRRALGEVEISLERVAAMTRAKDGPTWLVEFHNGDRLSGVPEIDRFDVATQFGDLSVGLENVERIVVAGTPPPALKDLPEGLALYYRFDTPAGAADDSGHGRAGTVHGAEFSPVGRLGGAMHFNGDSYIRCGGIRIGPEVTYSAWIKLDTLETGANFYVCRAGADHATLSGHHYTIELLQQFSTLPYRGLGRQTGYIPPGGSGEPGSSGGAPRIRACGAGASIVDGNYEFTDLDRWYHIAVTVDENGRLTTYVNGEKDASGDVAIAEVDSLYIGKSGFKGLIDEFMVFNRALSETEVARLYQLPGSAETSAAD